MQPISLYGSNYTPNPIKVAIILEELGVKYTVVEVPNKKADWYTKINPNGRVPSIRDPNTDVTVFETGACIEYLLSTYDHENKLQYTTSPEKWLTKSWLYLQVSGQGPYFGQLGWFKFLHPEKVQSAIDRYTKETKRITEVIDTHLRDQKTDYLVGDRVTYADLAFVPWYELVERIFFPQWDYKAEFPVFAGWHRRMMEREAVKRVFAMEEFSKFDSKVEDLDLVDR